MRILLLLALCSLITISCKQGNDVPQNSVAHKIYLEKDSGLVYCYADSQRVVFNNDYMDGGAMAMTDEVFVMQDNFYSYDGTLIRKGEDEYSYDDMIAQYSDSLVNADGFCCKIQND